MKFNFFLSVLLKIYLFDREKEHVHSRRGRQRERESPACSVLSTEPDAGLNLMTLTKITT